MASARSGVNRFYVLVGLAVVVGVVALVFMMRGGVPVSIPVDVTIEVSDTAGFSGYVIGSSEAPVEIIEYADFQCPACGVFATVQLPDIKNRLVATGRVRWVYRDFPLDQIHPFARLAAHSAACANEQGKFVEQHDRIYAGQARWSSGGANNMFRDYAREIGLDIAGYDDCMKSARYAGRIQASLEGGVRLGVNATPSLLINGRLYPGALGSDAIRRMVDSLAPIDAP